MQKMLCIFFVFTEFITMSFDVILLQRSVEPHVKKCVWQHCAQLGGDMFSSVIISFHSELTKSQCICVYSTTIAKVRCHHWLQARGTTDTGLSNQGRFSQ